MVMVQTTLLWKSAILSDSSQQQEKRWRYLMKGEVWASQNFVAVDNIFEVGP